jgi:hypothetical protein
MLHWQSLGAHAKACEPAIGGAGLNDLTTLNHHVGTAPDKGNDLTCFSTARQVSLANGAEQGRAAARSMRDSNQFRADLPTVIPEQFCSTIVLHPRWPGKNAGTTQSGLS